MVKAAILIDGGYFLRRLPKVRRDVNVHDPSEVVRSVNQLVRGHLEQLNGVYQLPNYFQLLYRTFYYDAWPYEGKEQTPVTKRPINYSKTDQAIFRRDLSMLCSIRQTLPYGWGRFAEIDHDSGC